MFLACFWQTDDDNLHIKELRNTITRKNYIKTNNKTY